MLPFYIQRSIQSQWNKVLIISSWLELLKPLVIILHSVSNSLALMITSGCF